MNVGATGYESEYVDRTFPHIPSLFWDFSLAALFNKPGLGETIAIFHRLQAAVFAREIELISSSTTTITYSIYSGPQGHMGTSLDPKYISS